jgi:2,3-bisphosphoglycerate-dependent phosphoglycerate mutase
MQRHLSELIVIRHGQSQANVAFAAADAHGLLDSGITGRDADVVLSPLGCQQAAALGRWLAQEPLRRRPHSVVCSPYARARQTWRIASHVAGRHGVELPRPRADTRLVDRLMGELELLTSAAVAARYPAEVTRRGQLGEFRYRPPGGESFGDVAERLTQLLVDLRRKHAGERVLVVAHDAVVLMLRYIIEDLTFDDLAALAQTDPIANASITRFSHQSGRLRLVEYNSVAHVADLGPRRGVQAEPVMEGAGAAL